MTRFQIFSDLHLEHRPWLADGISLRPDAEAVLLPGDIASGTEALAWPARLRPAHDRREILCLSGSHEAYGRTIERPAEEMARAAKATGVCLLTPGVRDVAGVRVIGATLWTDHTTSCRDKARKPKPAMMRRGIFFANACQRALNDSRRIRTGGRNISTGDVLVWHAGCLVVCNPAGHHPRENPRFDPDLVLEADPVRCNARLVQGL